MERDELIKRTDHYRCRLCGAISPITATVCTKASCRAQLGIYGELIMPGNVAEADGIPRVETTGKSKPVKEQKVKKEKPQPPVKVPREKPAARPVTYASETPAAKRSALIRIDVIFCLVYAVMIYCALWTTKRYYDTEAWTCVGIMLACTALLVCFARKRKYVLHGIISILLGPLSFVIAGTMNPDVDTAQMFIAQAAVYVWLGVISFIGTSRKRIAEEGEDAFLSQKTLLINLDVVGFVLACAMSCYRIGAQSQMWSGRYNLYFEDCIVPCLLQLAVAVPGIALICKDKNKLHSLFWYVAGVAQFLFALTLSGLIQDVVPRVTIAALYIWLGVMSSLEERALGGEPAVVIGTDRVGLWVILSYFTCIPAGLIVTAFMAFGFFAGKSELKTRITKILAMVGTLVGATIYIYALVNYDACDEAMYSSIIGLLTKLVIGDL